mmetsp:Transcript_23008/g.60095  ORF Transcript_23008/g.60095 Transcript_23008/m.60095 type:complete len:230 (-) Transcript_23008:741-1430(-)
MLMPEGDTTKNPLPHVSSLHACSSRRPSLAELFHPLVGRWAEDLCLLNHLVVDRRHLRRHEDVPRLRVDLGVEAGVADERNHPLFGVVLVHVQLLGQHLDRDCVVDSAVRLKDEAPGLFHEFLLDRAQEVVVAQNDGALAQLLLRAVKVKVDVETLQKVCDGVAVAVGFLLDEPDNIFHRRPLLLRHNDGGRDIPQNVRAHGLNRVGVLWLEEVQIDHLVQVGVYKDKK